jgi:hypothetical protein
MPSGMIQAAPMPDAIRAASSSGNEEARPQANTRTAQSAVAMAIMRYFPTRSPTGPLTSCIEPCTTV